MKDFYIEETIPDVAYIIQWRGQDIEKGLQELYRLGQERSNRFELWVEGWAETEKGYAPLAFSHKGKTKISHSCNFLFRN